MASTKILFPYKSRQKKNMSQGGTAPLDQQFVNFSRFGDNKSDGKSITLTCSDRWMRQAKILDMKRITTTHTGISFNKFKSRTITFQEFIKYLEDLAETTNTNLDEMKDKLMTCGMPGSSNKPDNVEPT